MKYLFVLIALIGQPGFASAQTVSTILPSIEASGDISIGPDGMIYAADFGASLRIAGGANILRIAPDGSAIDILSNTFGSASGNEFGTDGHLYQSDVGRGEVHRVAMDGTRTLIADGLTTPVGVAPAENGVTYVTECAPNSITRISRDEPTRRIAEGAPLNCPNGLSFGGDGKLYAVNFSDGAMVRIALSSGESEIVATIPGGGNGHLSWANERFYVASFRGHRIYSVSLDGEICLIAGSGKSGNDDGDALTASFFRPNGIAISADGDSLYTNTITRILDRADPELHPNSVRRIDGLLSLLDCPPERIVSTDAG